MPRRLPFVPQMEVGDCAAACLTMSLAHHGARVPLSEVRDVVGGGTGGADAQAIVEAAGSYGLSAYGVQADIDEVRRLPRGSILHWELRHFVVLDRVRRRYVDVVDPAQGRLRVSHERLSKSYTGVALVLEPDEGFQRRRGGSGLLRAYVRPLSGQRKLLRRVVTTSVLIRLLGLALPILMRLLVDDVLPSGDASLFPVLLGGLVAVLLYDAFASFVRAHLLVQLKGVVDVRTTTGFLEHLVGLPYSFFLRRSTGDLLTRLASLSAVREILTTSTLSALLDGGTALLYLVVLFVLDPLFGAVALVLGLMQAVVLVAARRRVRLLAAESLQATTRSQHAAVELVSGIHTLKASGAEHRMLSRWRRLFSHEMNATIARDRLDALINSAVGAARMGSPLVILMLGASRVLDGQLTVGTMLALTAVATGFLDPLANLVLSGVQLQHLGSFVARIEDVMQTPAEVRPDASPAAPLSGAVRAEDLWFRYSPAGPWVLQGVGVDVPAGCRVAIVGASGAGKSTLAHVLLGLFPPTSGRVLYDGVDLAGLDPRSVRSQVGIVTQNPYIFGTSVRENILIASPDLGPVELEAAAELACIDEDVRAMPMGFETRTAEGGATLSGGQRQRIALARAVVNRPAILLLDEATSALDAVTERRVYENLQQLGCTTIAIAHRLSTIEKADLIVVLESGRIVEQGTHSELVGLGGTYAGLVRAQRGDSGAADLDSDVQRPRPGPAGDATSHQRG